MLKFFITVISQTSTENLFLWHMEGFFVDRYGQECRNTGSVNSDFRGQNLVIFPPAYHKVASPLRWDMSFGLFKQEQVSHAAFLMKGPFHVGSQCQNCK